MRKHADQGTHQGSGYERSHVEPLVAKDSNLRLTGGKECFTGCETWVTHDSYHDSSTENYMLMRHGVKSGLTHGSCHDSSSENCMLMRITRECFLWGI